MPDDAVDDMRKRTDNALDPFLNFGLNLDIESNESASLKDNEEVQDVAAYSSRKKKVAEHSPEREERPEWKQ